MARLVANYGTLITLIIVDSRRFLHAVKVSESSSYTSNPATYREISLFGLRYKLCSVFASLMRDAFR